MSATIRKTLADLRRRKLQSGIILLVVALASFAGTLALSLLVEVNGPFDRAFQQANGAHLVMSFDSRIASLQQVRATANLAVVSQSSGPYREFGVGVSVPGGEQVLGVQGRDRPDTAVDRLTLDSGRWVRSTGEAVISGDLARHGTALGSVLTPDVQSGIPPLTVVGIATAVGDHVDMWVLPQQLPAQMASPVAGKPAEPAHSTMYYRLRQAGTDAAITAATNAIANALPVGAVVDTQNYLQIKRNAAITEAVMIPFLLALSVFALIAAALIVANVVTGAIIAGMRDLGIMKAVGFTPVQLIVVLLGQVLAPALIGVLAGIPLGIIASQPLIKDAASGFGLPVTFVVAPTVDALCLVGVLLIVVVAALVPALRAGRISAAEVIASATSPRRDSSAWFGRWLASIPVGRPLTLGAAQSFSRPVRSTITMVAVLLGVASVTFVLGLQQSLTMVAAGVARTGHVQVTVQRQGSSDQAISRLIRNEPGTARFVAERQTNVTLAGLGQPIALFSYRGESSWLGYPLIHGRWFHGSGEAVAPTALMTAAHLQVGDVTTIALPDRAITVRIVGVILDQTNDNMLLRTDASNLDPTVEADQYEVQLKPGTDADAYDRQLMDAAGANVIYAQTTDRSGVNSAFVLIDSVLAVLAIVLIAIAASGVFNTVVLNTREKARDIAILKAIGMTPRQTLGVVLASVIILGALGGTLGIPAGIIMHHAILQDMAQIASRTELPGSFYAVFSPALLGSMVVAGIALAILGAFVPAQWAARSRVTTVLHAE
jgi:putative ABC transport system permease protein